MARRAEQGPVNLDDSERGGVAEQPTMEVHSNRWEAMKRGTRQLVLDVSTKTQELFEQKGQEIKTKGGDAKKAFERLAKGAAVAAVLGLISGEAFKIAQDYFTHPQEKQPAATVPQSPEKQPAAAVPHSPEKKPSKAAPHTSEWYGKQPDVVLCIEEFKKSHPGVKEIRIVSVSEKSEFGVQQIGAGIVPREKNIHSEITFSVMSQDGTEKMVTGTFDQQTQIDPRAEALDIATQKMTGNLLRGDAKYGVTLRALEDGLTKVE